MTWGVHDQTLTHEIRGNSYSEEVQLVSTR